MADQVNQDFSYNDSLLLIVKLLDGTFLEGKKAHFTELMYIGFNVDTFFQGLRRSAIAANVTKRVFIEDMVDLIALAITRGNNYNTLSDANCKRNAVIRNLITRYNIQTTSKGSNMSLSRVCSVFPTITIAVFEQLMANENMTYPVSETEIGIPGTQFLSCSAIPSILEKGQLQEGNNAVMFIVFIIYSCHQSAKFSRKGGMGRDLSPAQFFGDCIKFAKAANAGSMVSDAGRTACVEKLGNITIQNKDLVAALDKLVSDRSFAPSATNDTVFELLLNTCHDKNKLLSASIGNASLLTLTMEGAMALSKKIK